MTKSALSLSVLGVTAFVLWSASVWACEIVVRDAAFRTPRDVHRLCVISKSGDTTALTTVKDLRKWLKGSAADMNIEVVHVDADDPKTRWRDYAIPSAPPGLPVVVLVGRDNGAGDRFLIDHWEPSLDDDDLSSLVSSPVRERLQQELGRRPAVLLFAPGSGSNNGAGSEKIDNLLKSVVKEWPADGIEIPGISVVRIDRNDPRERALISFAGLKRSGPDWLGVVFGRGKLMSPPLRGEEITSPRIVELLDQVVEKCSCSKPLPSLGIDIPMVWTDRMDDDVVPISELLDDTNDSPPVTVLPSFASLIDSKRGVDSKKGIDSKERLVSKEGSAVETRRADPVSNKTDEANTANTASSTNTEKKNTESGSHSSRLVATSSWALAAVVIVVLIGSMVMLRR